MRKFLLTLIGLFFTLPAVAQPTLWVCSNETTVLYMVVEATSADFFMFDSKGQSLGSSTFTKEKTDKGTEFFFGTIGTTGIGAMRLDETHVALIVSNGDSKTTVNFECN
jgi:hypothetical protein